MLNTIKLSVAKIVEEATLTTEAEKDKFEELVLTFLNGMRDLMSENPIFRFARLSTLVSSLMELYYDIDRLYMMLLCLNKSKYLP